MKNFLLIIVLVPALTLAQTRKQKKAQAKADKVTLANLQAHIQYLADDKLEGRRTGTAGELLAGTLGGVLVDSGRFYRSLPGFLARTNEGIVLLSTAWSRDPKARSCRSGRGSRRSTENGASGEWAARAA